MTEPMVRRFFVLRSCLCILQNLREATFFLCLHTPAREPLACSDGSGSASPCPLLDSHAETPMESQGAQNLVGLFADLCTFVHIPLTGSCSAPGKNTKQSSVPLPEFRDAGLPISVLFRLLTMGSAGVECTIAVQGAGVYPSGQGDKSDADQPL